MICGVIYRINVFIYGATVSPGLNKMTPFVSFVAFVRKIMNPEEIVIMSGTVPLCPDGTNHSPPMPIQLTTAKLSAGRCHADIKQPLLYQLS